MVDVEKRKEGDAGEEKGGRKVKQDKEARKELELKRNEEEEARRRENERREARDQKGELL